MALTVSRRQRNSLPLETIAEIADVVVTRLAPTVKAAVSNGISAGRGAAVARKSNQNNRKVSMGKRKAKKVESGGSSNPSMNNFELGRVVTLGGSDKLRMVQKDIISINNQATAGVCGYGTLLGIGTTIAGINTIGSVVPRFATMGPLYRQFVLNSISFTWVPNQGYTTGGTVCMGVDPSPFAGIATSNSSVLHHTSSKMFDLKASATIMWKPAHKANVPRYTQQIGTVDEDELSFGVFQLYSTNSIAASGNIGNLVISADITFTGAN